MNWASLIEALIPFVIQKVNPKLSPVASAITTGITEAEAIPNATGPEKLQHALNITTAAATAINSAAGKTVVDPVGLESDASQGIALAVQIANQVTKAPTPATN